jgi:putative protease
MSGMISERSANRGSCAQSCRKDYVLTDSDSREELDRGYLISTKDLGAYDHLAAIADAGVGCLKVEGRKKKPEYVATVTRSYRDFLDRVEQGDTTPPTVEEVQPLVQIFSRGFTGGMYGGREGREYVTRTQPDNKGVVLGDVVGYERGELIVDVSQPLRTGDGVGFEAPGSVGGPTTGFSITNVRTLGSRTTIRQALETRVRVAPGWRVVRTSEAQLLERARATYASLPKEIRARKSRLDVRVFGAAGTPLKAVFVADGETVTVRSEITLAPASKRALDATSLREQFGRLGDTPFVLGTLDVSGLSGGLFLPVSEQNHVRQSAVEQLMLHRDWAREAKLAERRAKVEEAVRHPDERSADRRPPGRSDGSPLGREELSAPAGIRRRFAPQDEQGGDAPQDDRALLSAQVYTIDDAEAASDGGANEIVFDPFLRHPAPPVARIRALDEKLRERGITLRLRTPTIVRPEERKSIQKWLDLGLPLLSGHLGLVHELGAAGRDVVADYAVNVFNAHTAAEIFALGASRIVASVELTADELAQLVEPWRGSGFDVFLYGRPEGMTIEHCVLSAAFDREPTTCRDLCVKSHTNVELTDPAGYTFPVATDAACRNRLLHSRPVDGSEFLPKLWRAGIRGYHVVFNVPGDDVRAIVAGYRAQLDALSSGTRPDADAVRDLLHGEFTRGHFARAV